MIQRVGERKRQSTDAMHCVCLQIKYMLMVSNDNVSCLFSRAYIMKRHVLLEPDFSIIQ